MLSVTVLVLILINIEANIFERVAKEVSLFFLRKHVEKMETDKIQN